MFRANTVLVIGAGASVEVGLPMGPNLLNDIANRLDIAFDYNQQTNGDRVLYQALRLALNEDRSVDLSNSHLLAGRQLRESARQALSIDNVIDALEDPKVELIGKLGIVRAILHAEGASNMFRPPERGRDELQLAQFAPTWYSSLTQLLTENVRRSLVGDIFTNLQVINFNYDRCLEHYLPYSLANYYGLPLADAQRVVAKLRVHRPYGVAGRLPWQPGDAPAVQFGGGSAAEVAEVAPLIRTFTEQVEEGTLLEAMREAVAEAERIVFLGFAFHRQNMQLIGRPALENAEVLATAYGISRSDRGVIETELGDALWPDETPGQGQIQLAEMTCADLFRNYWRTLTAGPGNNGPMRLGTDVYNDLGLSGRSF